MKNQEEGDETGIGCSTQDIARQQIIVSKYKQHNLGHPNWWPLRQNNRENWFSLSRRPKYEKECDVFSLNGGEGNIIYWIIYSYYVNGIILKRWTTYGTHKNSKYINRPKGVQRWPALFLCYKILTNIYFKYILGTVLRLCVCMHRNAHKHNNDKQKTMAIDTNHLTWMTISLPYRYKTPVNPAVRQSVLLKEVQLCGSAWLRRLRFMCRLH